MSKSLSVMHSGECPVTKEQQKKIKVIYQFVYDTNTGGDYERSGLVCPDVNNCTETRGCPIFLSAKNRISR